MLRNAPQVVENCATMGLFVAQIAKVRTMSKGTWRQQMMDLFLRRERIPKRASELAQKISKDKANLEGLGENNEE